MSGLLLDTHVIVWLASSFHRVPVRVRNTLEAADDLWVSPVSSFEIAQKVRLGKLPGAEGILARWDELLDELMATETPLTHREMAKAGSLLWEHRDPFDRMLVATAQLQGMQIVTKDAAIRSFSEVSCVDWA